MCTALPVAAECEHARNQISLTLCESCKRGWQDASGRVIEVESKAIERAMCDAEHIGSLDAKKPSRAAQDIPPATPRLVKRRDHGRCRIPGCRSAAHCEIHHIVLRM